MSTKIVHQVASWVLSYPHDDVVAALPELAAALRELGVFSTNVMSRPMSPIEGESVERIRAILRGADLLDG